MHFYTYDDWVANAYYSKDNKEIPIGQTAVYEMTSDTPRYLSIRSCWKNPRFISTYPGIPSIVPTEQKIDLDLGCICKLKDGTYKVYQYLGGDLGSVLDPPYIQLDDGEEKYDSFTDMNKEILNMNIKIDGIADIYDSAIIFQSVYSGAISFQQCDSCLEFFFTNVPSTLDGVEYSNYDYISYDYKINTNLYSDTSLMIAAAKIEFDNTNTRKYIRIENLSKFVYGQEDLARTFGYGDIRWKSFQPPKGASPMPSSIMHYAKRSE